MAAADPEAAHPATAPWVADAVLAVAVTLVLSLVIAADVDESRPEGSAYLWAAGLGALMLVRRRYPAAVVALTGVGLFGYYAAGYPPVGVAVPVAAAVFSAAEAGRLAVAVVGSVAILAIATGYRLAVGQAASFVLGYELVWNGLLLAAVVALGDGVRSRRELGVRAREVAALLAERYRRQAEERVTRERLTMARDVHDSVGHALTVVALHAQVAGEAIGRDDAVAADAVDVIRDTTTATLTDLRRTVALLRQAAPAARDVPGLGDLATALRPAQQAGLDVVADIHAGSAPGPAGAVAYRIVQEAITNVVRHARASRVRVDVRADDGILRVRVEDDGPAGVGPSTVGHGITGMRERAEALGGSLTAGPTPTGFVVAAALPMEEEP
ncbi:sensor histidine kinase [Cellulomonas fengjieae]|uniref:sensor histidine kinase n=1 Tax=Cellulomonas fengjieae TaxID=2819978 RepID=UPI001AAE3E90|nr:histidine kinase [Cellulomonas fengjieae]MBO3102550.1 sensor histidine kinase [Cellulomonas fengjieae]